MIWLCVCVRPSIHRYTDRVYAFVRVIDIEYCPLLHLLSHFSYYDGILLNSFKQFLVIGGLIGIAAITLTGLRRRKPPPIAIDQRAVAAGQQWPVRRRHRHRHRRRRRIYSRRTCGTTTERRIYRAAYLSIFFW